MSRLTDLRTATGQPELLLLVPCVSAQRQATSPKDVMHMAILAILALIAWALFLLAVSILAVKLSLDLNRQHRELRELTRRANEQAERFDAQWRRDD